jgi:hypothetical protein
MVVEGGAKMKGEVRGGPRAYASGFLQPRVQQEAFSYWVVALREVNAREGI